SHRVIAPGVLTQADILRLVPSDPVGLHCTPRSSSLMGGLARDAETVFGQPVFGLNARESIRYDLMNPPVVPHLEFVPEDAHRRDIYKMSQSSKWLKHLERDL
ncbi:hypothetical protein PSTT_06742, partial [Puccinia striiformis]